jgi:hypothetical protein
MTDADISPNLPAQIPKQRTLPTDDGHTCLVCGKFGPFGFSGSLRHKRAFRWACASHREEVRKMGGAI